MKNQVLTLAVALTSLNVFSQDIKVKESNESFSNGKHNALQVTLYVTDISMVEKEWKSQLKGFGYDKAHEQKDEYFFDNVLFKDMSTNTVDVYSKVDELKGDKAVQLTAAFDLGGAYLNSSDHKSQIDFMKKMMHDFAVKVTKDVLDDQLKDASKALSTLQSKQASLEKDNKGLVDDITGYNNKIKKANDQIEQNKKDIETKKTEVSAQQKIYDGLKSKKDGIK